MHTETGGRSDAARRRVFDAAVTLAALAAGGVAAAELRQPWARGPAGSWVWALLVAAGLLGGFALRRMSAWLEDEQPPPRLARGAAAKSTRIALACLGLAGLVTVWLMHRLWPDYHVWQGTLIPWVAALVLTAAAGSLSGRRRPRGRPRTPAPGAGDASAVRRREAASAALVERAGRPLPPHCGARLVRQGLPDRRDPGRDLCGRDNAGLDALRILEEQRHPVRGRVVRHADRV